jgi:hypothetical protein
MESWAKKEDIGLRSYECRILLMAMVGNVFGIYSGVATFVSAMNVGSGYALTLGDRIVLICVTLVICVCNTWRVILMIQNFLSSPFTPALCI